MTACHMSLGSIQITAALLALSCTSLYCNCPKYFFSEALMPDCGPQINFIFVAKETVSGIHVLKSHCL